MCVHGTYSHCACVCECVSSLYRLRLFCQFSKNASRAPTIATHHPNLRLSPLLLPLFAACCRCCRRRRRPVLVNCSTKQQPHSSFDTHCCCSLFCSQSPDHSFDSPIFKAGVAEVFHILYHSVVVVSPTSAAAGGSDTFLYVLSIIV